MTLAMQFVDTQLRTGVTFDGSPVRCHASTRRVPCSGCHCRDEVRSSHKHLGEVVAEVVAA